MNRVERMKRARDKRRRRAERREVIQSMQELIARLREKRPDLPHGT